MDLSTNQERIQARRHGKRMFENSNGGDKNRRKICQHCFRYLWADLKERFGKERAPRAYELKQNLSMTHQNGVTVSVYYTKLRSLWDEIESVQPMPKCSCNKCTCDVGKKLSGLREKERLYEFLMGLDDHFSRAISADKKPVTEVAAFKASGPMRREGSQFQRRDKSIQKDAKRVEVVKHCTNYEKDGHSRDGRFELIGYPEWWSGNKKREETKPKAAFFEPGRSSPIPGLTNEQYESFLKHFSEMGSSGKKDNASKAYMTDKGNNDDYWVIDLGSTKHITHDASILENNTKSHFETPVIIPNGEAILVEGKGECLLPGGTKIKGVLHIPKFTCNLLFVRSTEHITHDASILENNTKSHFETRSSFPMGKRYRNSHEGVDWCGLSVECVYNECGSWTGEERPEDNYGYLAQKIRACICGPPENNQQNAIENLGHEVVYETLNDNTSNLFSDKVGNMNNMTEEGGLDPSDQIGRPTRHRSQPKCLDDFIRLSIIIDEPKIFHQAIEDDRWKEVMRKEIRALEENGLMGEVAITSPPIVTLIVLDALTHDDPEPDISLVGGGFFSLFPPHPLPLFLSTPTLLSFPIKIYPPPPPSLRQIISWKTKKQSVVSCSSIEAEYRLMASTVSEVLWVRWLLQELSVASTGPTSLFYDNQAALDSKEVQPFPIDSKMQIVDLLTKGLGTLQLRKFSFIFHVATVTKLVVQKRSAADNEDMDPTKLGVVMKPMEKPRMILKYIWMEKNIEIAQYQVKGRKCIKKDFAQQRRERMKDRGVDLKKINSLLGICNEEAGLKADISKKYLKEIYGVSPLDSRSAKNKSYRESRKKNIRDKDKATAYATQPVSFISCGIMESEPGVTIIAVDE
ncbi:putative RNA-directed DNA polymerase [Tanacetum coccineum]|uniref:RNA-directed DNA polymerase n=1 Tax=Tanacetum coccineum TaxID=301880 RepID=A0ABQ5G3J2_9ASTR